MSQITPFIAACLICNFQRGWSGTEAGERQSFCLKCGKATMHKIYASHPDSAALFEPAIPEHLQPHGSAATAPYVPHQPEPSTPKPNIMFLKLSELLKDKCDTITMTVARASDTELRVNFIPRLNHDVPAVEKGLNTPLQVVATPAELDSPAFLETLSRYNASATGLVAAVEAVESKHKAAAAEATAPKAKDKTPAQVAAKKAEKAAGPEAEEETEAEANPLGI